MKTIRQFLLVAASFALGMGMTTWLLSQWPDGFRMVSVYIILTFTVFETGRCFYRVCIQDDGSTCDWEYIDEHKSGVIPVFNEPNQHRS